LWDLAPDPWESGMQSSLKRRTRLALKIAAMVMLTLVIAGIAYEHVGERQDRQRYPQIGRSVNIGGRTLNIYCSGQGEPTVVLESGGHTAGYGWVLVQPRIAQFTRACWYDRAGYGWSDPGSFPRTSNAIANDLHALLRAADIPGRTCSWALTSAASAFGCTTGFIPVTWRAWSYWTERIRISLHMSRLRLRACWLDCPGLCSVLSVGRARFLGG
jgi:hypothetical protein